MGRGRTRVGDPLQCLRPADAELPRSGGCRLIGPGWLGLVVSPVRGIGWDGVTGRRCGEGAGFQRRGAIGAGGLGAGAASRRALVCLSRRSFRKVLRGAVCVVDGRGRRKRRGCVDRVRTVRSVDHVHPQDAGNDGCHQQQERSAPSESSKSQVGQEIVHCTCAPSPSLRTSAAYPGRVFRSSWQQRRPLRPANPPDVEIPGVRKRIPRSAASICLEP